MKERSKTEIESESESEKSRLFHGANLVVRPALGQSVEKVDPATGVRVSQRLQTRSLQSGESRTFALCGKNNVRNCDLLQSDAIGRNSERCSHHTDLSRFVLPISDPSALNL